MKLSFSSILFLFSISIFSQTSQPKTVKYVDLKKYTGLWYEIAKIPNSFQDQCVKGTIAKYTLNEEGEISIINSCLDEDGEVDDTDGIARVVDSKTNAKLEVSYFSILGWRPFWDDYWIIGLDKNYQWAIVGTPDREYGWVLSRTTHIDQQTLDEIYMILKEQGYNKEDFAISMQ